ncbi:hypothetical protein ACW9HE_19800 [Nocardia gipuzkoensis]
MASIAGTSPILSGAGRGALYALPAARLRELIEEVLAESGFPGLATPPPLAAYSNAVITVGSLSKTV